MFCVGDADYESNFFMRHTLQHQKDTHFYSKNCEKNPAINVFKLYSKDPAGYFLLPDPDMYFFRKVKSGPHYYDTYYIIVSGNLYT